MNAEEILKKLVAFPCLGGESNLPIIHWIGSYLESAGVEYRLVYNDEKNKASLHCRIGPAFDGGVILSGHTDVVPVEGQDWSSEPFTLTDKSDGRLYGRGSCDMKGFLACCLASIPFIQKQQLKCPIYFAFSYDEEIGCLGAPELIEDIQSYYEERPAYAIIGEPSMMELVAGQKGICVMETEVNGSAGHSSMILQEVSAIHEAARLVSWLEDKMAHLARYGRHDERFTPPHSSIHVGTIRGGIASNVIADKCLFQWDIRNMPGDQVSGILEEFESFCRERENQCQQRFAGFRIRNTALIKPVPALDSFNEKNLLSYMKKLSGQDTLYAVSYAAEAGQFSEAGIPAIICGPGSIAQAHRANEFIDKDQLRLCKTLLENLARLSAE